MTTIQLSDTTLELDVRDNHLRSLGDIRIHGTPLRNTANRFLPYIDTFQGDQFRRFELLEIDKNDQQVRIRTRAVSDSDAMYQERRDASGDPCLRSESWDAEPKYGELDIILEPASAEIDGHAFSGFKYWFEFRSTDVQIHRLMDRQTWEVGGDLDDVTVLCRSLFDNPCKRVTVDSGFSTVGLDNYAKLLPGNFWARWSLLPAFDMQTGSAGTMVGWFDQVSLIRSVIESKPGENWVRYIDLHGFASTYEAATNPKTILYCPDVLDEVTRLNLWTRVHDQEYFKAREQFGMKEEAPPAITFSHNEWRNFHFDTTYETTIELASEFGADHVFIDPVWQNMEEYRRTLEALIPEEQRRDSVLEKHYHANMCCTLDFEVAKAAGGEDGLARLCERAARKGVDIISWMALHYHPDTMLDRDKSLGHGNGGIFAAKESGRHPDTGYPSACWTVNLNTPIYDKLCRQFIDTAKRVGLKGYLWDSFSNLGWWQIDYSDGSMRPQFDKMAQLYADLVNEDLYIKPEAYVSFSRHSCCGCHGGNIYEGDNLGYAYDTVIGLRYLDQQTGKWTVDMTEEMIRGERPLDLLFRCFAHKRVPSTGFYKIPRDQWDATAVEGFKAIFAAYKAARVSMHRRTVLHGDAGVLWEGSDGGRLIWSFANQTPGGIWEDIVSGDVTTTLQPLRVYRQQQ